MDQIIIKNEVIAIFDGWEKEFGTWRKIVNSKGLSLIAEKLDFHSDWNLLMSVVKKCHTISVEKQNQYPDEKGLDDPAGWRSWSYRYIKLSTDKEKVHEAVYQFIQWYNNYMTSKTKTYGTNCS